MGGQCSVNRAGAGRQFIMLDVWKLDPGHPTRRWYHALLLALLVNIPMTGVFELVFFRPLSLKSYATMLLLGVAQSLLGFDWWFGRLIACALHIRRRRRKVHLDIIAAVGSRRQRVVHVVREPSLAILPG